MCWPHLQGRDGPLAREDHGTLQRMSGPKCLLRLCRGKATCVSVGGASEVREGVAV